LTPANAGEGRRLSRRVMAAGIHPPFIRYPGGPEGGSFRFAISSEHTGEQLDRLAGVLTGRPDAVRPTPE
jgi:7-keto-8-aminopelargonate synthetase-like enzyme